VSRLTSLTHTFTSVHKLHISSARLHGKKMQHYMCLGKPVFTGPMKQITAVRKCKYGISHLRYLLKADRDLRTGLQNHIDDINKKNTMNY